MIDVDTFITILYVMVDDFCQSKWVDEKPRPGPRASLEPGEVITLALFGQWVHFPSERAFYRYAEQHLRAAFPTLPNRSQFNRLQRRYRETITAFGLELVEVMKAQHACYEALDSTPPSLLVMPSGEEPAGWPVKPICASVTDWDATKAFTCCSRSLQSGSLPALARERLDARSRVG